MVNSGSPTLTSWPSLKCSSSMKPETRARTSTEATASKRPENSSHWVTRLAIGGATLTGMAGGPPWAGGAAEGERKKEGAAARTAGQNGQTHTPPHVLWRGTQCAAAGATPI